MKRFGVAMPAALFALALTGPAKGADPGAEAEKPSAFEVFRAREFQEFRGYARKLSEQGVKQPELAEKFKEYAEGMIKRYASFRESKEGAPHATEADQDVLMIMLDLLQDNARVDQFIGTRGDAKYRAGLRIHLARLWIQRRQPAKATKVIEKVLAETAEKYPELHAEARRVEFQIDPIGKPFPEFPEGTKDTDGKPIRIADYKGKVVLVDFWAAWCGPCRVEMPNVVKAYKKYHPKGFEIIGISLDHSRKDLSTALKEFGMTWRQYYDGKGWQNEVSTSYGVGSIPAMYLIGPDGKVVSDSARGPALPRALEKHLGKS